tara:strand:- start:365 stop:688 length:324 start_codon:yes stop_codon:yes gene_type:complete
MNDFEDRKPKDKLRRQNRRKIVYLPQTFLLQFLNFQPLTSGRGRFPKMSGIPESAHVVAMYNEPWREALALVVEDRSFDEVPEGERLPEIPVNWVLVEWSVKPTFNA